MALNDRLELWRGRFAVRQLSNGEVFTYDDQVRDRDAFATKLIHACQVLPGDRVAFMFAPGHAYVSTLLGIWKAGGIAVPLSSAYPEDELKYFLETVSPKVVVADASCLPVLANACSRLGIPLRDRAGLPETVLQPVFPAVDSHSTALILFTSGTTSRPKGVMITHVNLQTQMAMLCEAWEWQPQDRILHALPLHHVHGIVNALLCALWAGASVHFLPKFDASRAWELFISREINVFMGVPTMYAKLLEQYDLSGPASQTAMSSAARDLRLTVSGSAALPVRFQERWKVVSGRFLLERYGMTEIGMALGVPFRSEGAPGKVGLPFPGVEVRVVDEDGEDAAQGELWVKGPSVFAGYWNRPKETAEAFQEGWFMTGDVVERDENGYFRILGRKSSDILKSGGYKLSALEIEEVFREHPQVVDCAVVGLEDETWGEMVAMAFVGADGMMAEGLEAWGKQRMAAYKLPRRYLQVAELPRNAMGKVVKAKVKELFMKA